MQFLKNLQKQDSNQHSNSNGKGKFDIDKYISRLFPFPYLHDSKKNLLYTLSHLTLQEENENGGGQINNGGLSYFHNELLEEITQVSSNSIILNKLKGLFEGISSFKFKLEKQDKEELETLLRNKIISQRLRDATLAVYDPQELIPDITASQIQLLFVNGHLKSQFVRDCLKCCRDLIYNMGYDQLNLATNITLEEDELDTIVNQCSAEIKNVLIIPGCQQEGMLEGRVLKAVDLLKHFKREGLIIIASGGNPLENPKNPPDTISTGNEANAIFTLLDEFIKKLNVKAPPKLIPKIESKSFDSTANVRESISSGKYMNHSEQHNLIIVSSSFHLIKLSRVVEEEVEKIRRINPNFVHNIILFGSEQIEDEFSTEKRGGYIKSMFVEVYKELLTFYKKKSNGVTK